MLVLGSDAPTLTWFVPIELEQKATIFGDRVKGGFVVVHDWYQLSCIDNGTERYNLRKG